MTLSARFFVLISLACSVALVLNGRAAAVEVLHYAGATTLQKDFMMEASHRFSKSHDVRFELEGGNSGAGLKALSAGAADIAGSGRFLTSKEKETGLQEHLVGWDPLVLVVHVTNSVENVSREELRRMLLGTVRNWKEVKGRDLPLLQVAAPQGSGVRGAAEELLLNNEPLSSRAIVSLVVADADKNVGLLPAGFTLTSLSMVDADRIKIIKVDGVMPSLETITSGAYPLLKPLLLVTNGKAKGSLALFIDFAKGPEGQAIIAKKFIPLPVK